MRNYIDEYLIYNIDEASIQIERAHRIQGKNSPGPIIVKFLHYKDIENVLKTYHEKRKNIVSQAQDNLSNEEDVWKTIYVSEYFPESVIRVRSKLYPFLKLSIEDRRNSYLNYDRLMVNGYEYTYDYDNSQPTFARI